jgi:protein-S-isoprenylcysteine O-methyltransferase Ste14
MESLAVGGLGFVMILLYDLAQINGRNRFARTLSSIGYAAVLASIVFPLARLKPAQSPLIVLVLLGAIAALGFALLVYSVLIEIPLALKRVGLNASGPRRVVASGTYSGVRHPGFLWFALCLAALALLYRHRAMTEIAAGLMLFDFTLIVIEDLLLFPRIFQDYEQYKKNVPFLVPRFARRK